MNCIENRRRAATEGLTLSDYLVREIAKLADRPTVAELRSRIAQRSAAEALDATLLTCDGKLAKARSHAARIEVA
jgi:hypothetical protein